MRIHSTYPMSVSSRSMPLFRCFIGIVFFVGFLQQGVLAQDIDFDIQGQATNETLLELAETAGIQIAFAADRASQSVSPAVSGSRSVEQALDVALDGTGLGYQFADRDFVVVKDAQGFGMQADRLQAANIPPSTLLAQLQVEERESDEDEEKKKREVEEMTVTGSRIRGAKSASPVTTITSLDIEMAGFATVEQIVENLPQNFGAGATQDTSTDRNRGRTSVGGLVGNITGGSSVNLRGLGASSTLVLLDGRRMSPSGLAADFTDISGIPVSAIERVEVLTDGASAIYGSDAIGGVVNFILRDTYEGAETRLRYGSGSGGDTTETLFGQSFGKSWDGGNVLFSYEYYQHDNLANSDVDFASSQDLTRFGGTDWRLFNPGTGGNPGTLFDSATFTTYAIPAGQDGTSLTPADFVGLAGTSTLRDIRTAQDLIPELERHSAYLNLTQNIGSAELFAQARFSTRENEQRIDQELLQFLFVTDANPFFVDPSGTGLTSVFVNYLPTPDIGPAIQGGDTDSFGGVLGVRFDIGNAWQGEFVGNWNKEEAIQTLSNSVNQTALAAALSQMDPQLAFNPFGDGSNTNPTVIEGIRQARGDDLSVENELRSIGFNVDGEVLSIPGGAIQIASGIEFREESLASEFGRRQPDGSVVPDPLGDFDREILAIYTEFFFPLVGSDNSWPGVRRLELSLAARYEDYSDFGDTTDPKIGLVWSPTQSLTFRGTYGTSFKAPSLTNLDVSSPFDDFAYYPTVFVPPLPFPVIVLSGGNKDLTAEEATTWATGVQWDSESIKGLSLDVTYFNIDFENRIDFPFSNFVDGINDPRFSSLLITDPTEIAAQIPTLVNDPQWDETAFGVFTPSADVLSGAVPVGGIFDARVNNLARAVVTGVEFQLSYAFETTLGLFDIGFNGNYLFDFERQIISTDPLVDEVDTLGRPIDFRGRGNITWTRQAWSVSGFVNYVDDYVDNQSDPARPIDSWTTVDLSISYDTGNNKGFLSDTRLSLSAQNLFDEDPPFADTFGGLAYDSANHNGLGQFVALQITKEW